MAKHYVVAYNGQLAEGKSLESVKQGVAQLFKVDIAKVEHLFGGQWVSIKKGIEQTTAEKYRQALAKMGAICRVVSESEFAELKSAPVGEAALASEKSPAKHKPSVTDSGLEPEHSVVKAAPAGLGELEAVAVESDWDQLEEHDDTPPLEVDLAGVAIVELGADLAEHQDVADLEIDTHEFLLDPLGVDMAEHEEVADLKIDTSVMALDELGVSIAEHQPVEKSDIDTSKISLA